MLVKVFAVFSYQVAPEHGPLSLTKRQQEGGSPTVGFLGHTGLGAEAASRTAYRLTLCGCLVLASAAAAYSTDVDPPRETSHAAPLSHCHPLLPNSFL